MSELGVPAGLQRYYITQTQHPTMTRKQIRGFMQYAAPEQVRSDTWNISATSARVRSGD